MPIRDILQLGDPLLRQKAVAVEDPTAQEVHDLVRDMAGVLTSFCARLYGRRSAKRRAGLALCRVRVPVNNSAPYEH